jgi:hypothetical protein
MGAAGAAAPAVDDVTFGFCTVDECNIAADWAIHWLSSSAAILSRVVMRMYSTPSINSVSIRQSLQQVRSAAAKHFAGVHS